MLWWRKKSKRRQLPDRLELPDPDCRYGLDPDNPVLCGGSVAGQIDYFERLRCPSGSTIRFERLGPLPRANTDYLDRSDVELKVSRGTRRRVEKFGVRDTPLDLYAVACDCGEHEEEVFIDMYFRGPESPIDARGWTLAPGISPAVTVDDTADCPYCGQELRTLTAKQCRHCKMDWHDP